MGSDEVLLRQKHLNMTFFAVTLMVITTIQWITLDMYLPALPVLKEEFATTEAMLNISMNTGIVATAIGTLFSGTLSDRYGRKMVLLLGLMISGLCTFLCAFSKGIVFLSVMRGIAGLGCGCAETVTAAMMKDSFTGKRFQRLMTIMQSIAAVGPLFAPTLGSIMINISSWHAIFYFLGGATALTAVPIVISTETWPKEGRTAEDLGQVLKDAVGIAKAPAFICFLGVASFLTIPIWAYVAASPYIFINEFSLCNTTYGVLYGIGSAASIVAPFLYLLLMRKSNGKTVVRVTIALTVVGAGSILLLGCFHPFIYLASVIPILLAEGMIRPLSIVVLLEEYSYAAGSASALMQFIINLVGIVGTTAATLPWHSMAGGTGFISGSCGILALLLWGIIRKRQLLKARLE